MNISIIYEDEDMIAVNKPAGLTVHPDGRSEDATLSEWVVEKYPGIKNVGEHIKLSSGKELKKHGIVHRLDRDTSGVLIIAKNQDAYLYFKKQFQEREVKKIYRAIVYGRIKTKKGIIDAPIGKSKNDFRQWSTEGNARGVLRMAETEYEALKTTADYSYVELKPKTGRTHQLRVHLKSIGHPVLCDKLYARNRACAGGINRMALHALFIALSSREGVLLNIEAPIAKDFETALAELQLS